MRIVLKCAVGLFVTAGLIFSFLGMQAVVESGRLDHLQMTIQLEPVITFSKQDPFEPLLHVRVDAVAHVPLSVWLHRDVAEVKLREAMAFEIRNTSANRLANLDQDQFERHIAWRAKRMHGIKVIDLEVSRFSTAG